jgi:hypothetical protein
MPELLAAITLIFEGAVTTGAPASLIVTVAVAVLVFPLLDVSVNVTVVTPVVNALGASFVNTAGVGLKSTKLALFRKLCILLSDLATILLLEATSKLILEGGIMSGTEPAMATIALKP